MSLSSYNDNNDSSRVPQKQPRSCDQSRSRVLQLGINGRGGRRNLKRQQESIEADEERLRQLRLLHLRDIHQSKHQLVAQIVEERLLHKKKDLETLLLYQRKSATSISHLATQYRLYIDEPDASESLRKEWKTKLVVFELHRFLTKTDHIITTPSPSQCDYTKFSARDRLQELLEEALKEAYRLQVEAHIAMSELSRFEPLRRLLYSGNEELSVFVRRGEEAIKDNSIVLDCLRRLISLNFFADPRLSAEWQDFERQRKDERDLKRIGEIKEMERQLQQSNLSLPKFGGGEDARSERMLNLMEAKIEEWKVQKRNKGGI